MIWIIGGTVEANRLAKDLQDDLELMMTVATEGGLQFATAEEVQAGRLTKEQMHSLIEEKGIVAIVDMSHPYAKIVSSQAKEVAKEANIDYERFLRPPNAESKDAILVDTLEECIGEIEKREGVFLFTTGSKNIKDFEPHRGNRRFIYRVLPTSESMQLAEDAGVTMRDLIGALGPFDEEFNRLLMRRYHVNYCVTKESGKGAGVDEKFSACEKEGVIPIVLRRDREEGWKDLLLLEDELRRRYGRELSVRPK